MTAANLISTPVARRHGAIPVAFADEHTLLVAMADPSNVLAIDDMAIMTGYDVRVAVAPPEDIASLISRLNRLEDVVEGQIEEDVETDGDGAEVVALHDGSEDAPVVKLVNQLVAQAVERGASDLHLAAGGHGKSGCASASTGCCRTSPRCPARWPAEWSRASRSWPTSTSPSGACPRTAASACRSTAGTSTCAW